MRSRCQCRRLPTPWYNSLMVEALAIGALHFEFQIKLGGVFYERRERCKRPRFARTLPAVMENNVKLRLWLFGSMRVSALNGPRTKGGHGRILFTQQFGKQCAFRALLLCCGPASSVKRTTRPVTRLLPSLKWAIGVARWRDEMECHRGIEVEVVVEVCLRSFESWEISWSSRADLRPRKC